MSYVSQIFWKHSEDVCSLVPKIFKFLVCLSVCALPYFLTEIQLTLDISSSEWAIFLKFSGDILGVFIHWFQIISDFLYVYQSVHYLSSLLKIGYQWYLRFWMSYLSQIFWRYSWEVCSLFSNNFMFFVCLSVCSLPHFVTEISLSMISLVLDELSF